MSLKLESILSQSYRKASKVMHFVKVYFDSLRVSLGPCGCIYDNKTIKLSYHVRNYWTLIGIRQFSYISHKYLEKVCINTV